MDFIEPTQIFRLLAVLAFVVALMAGLAYVLKRFGLSGYGVMHGHDARLNIIETMPLDARRRLVLIQRDDVQHLVILGATSETVVETGIKPVQTQTHIETKKNKDKQDS